MNDEHVPCDGPLIWFDVPPSDIRAVRYTNAAILECSRCGYVVVTGNMHDDRHVNTPVISEGLAA